MALHMIQVTCHWLVQITHIDSGTQTYLVYTWQASALIVRCSNAFISEAQLVKVITVQG